MINNRNKYIAWARALLLPLLFRSIKGECDRARIENRKSATRVVGRVRVFIKSLPLVTIRDTELSWIELSDKSDVNARDTD